MMFSKKRNVDTIVRDLNEMVTELGDAHARLDGEAISIQGKINDLSSRREAALNEGSRALRIAEKIAELLE